MSAGKYTFYFKDGRKEVSDGDNLEAAFRSLNYNEKDVPDLHICYTGDVDYLEYKEGKWEPKFSN